MQDDNDNNRTPTFLNRREWGTYLSALQGAAAYPKMLDSVYPKVREAVNSGCAWFTEGAAQASNWLVGSTRQLRDKFSAG
jgi:hypothetical protein